MAGASALAVGGSLYALAVRPRIARWGATDEEVTRLLPGDELPATYGNRRVSTRAITIDAPPAEVWPWIVQMGSGRAGFYTHERLERLMGATYAEGHSSTSIHPEWQEPHVADRVPYWRPACQGDRGSRRARPAGHGPVDGSMSRRALDSGP